MNYLVVFIGAGFGGIFRYFLSSLIQKQFPPYFPWGTLTVNLLGSFILGLMIFGLDEKGLISPTLKLFIGIGFCGGFTTFSTFSWEVMSLLKSGIYSTAFLYAGLSFAATLLMTVLGFYIGK